MPNIGPIDRALRAALGQGVGPIAELYTVYRLNATSSGQIMSPSNVVRTNYKARITKVVPTALLEQRTLYPLLYSGFCDTRALQIGDILVQTGPILTDTPDGRIFALTCVQPLLAPVFARVEVLSALSSPHSIQTIAEPLVGDGGVASTTKSTEWLVSLTNGLYSVGPQGPAAVIPCGLQLRERGGGPQEVKYPSSAPRGEFDFYMPPLPGYEIRPNDVISDAVGNRYRVTVPILYTSGLQGWYGRATTLFV